MMRPYLFVPDFVYWLMARLDLGLLIVFGVISLVTLTGAVLSFRKAMRVSGERDGDLKMFFWAAGSMVGLIISGLSAAYILLPILYTYLFKR